MASSPAIRSAAPELEPAPTPHMPIADMGMAMGMLHGDMNNDGDHILHAHDAGSEEAAAERSSSPESFASVSEAPHSTPAPVEASDLSKTTISANSVPDSPKTPAPSPHPGADSTTESDSSDNDDEDREYNVLEIKDFRRVYSRGDRKDEPVQVEMLVSWDGYPGQDSWEPEDKLHRGSPNLLFRFWSALRGRTQKLGLKNTDVFEIFRIVDHAVPGASDDTQAVGDAMVWVEWVGYRRRTWQWVKDTPKHLIDDYCKGKNIKLA